MTVITKDIRAMRNLCISILSIAAATLSSACSSNDSTPAPGDGGAAGGGNTIALLPDGGCPDPANQVFDGIQSCIPKTEGIAQCKAAAKAQTPGANVDDPTCGAGCTCVECTSEMLQCGNDPDNDGYCSTILKCAQEKNCSGVACYNPMTCQAEIDNAPGGGLSSISVAFATQVSDCATKTALFANRPGGTCLPSCL
jgi:hypothetical protein